ncbi:MAG: hypothetical protein NZ921_00350 [Candidatus Caldarchaeum sp.]|nr:hypothetical protein [Candidatus Caldarchaeum sp.]
MAVGRQVLGYISAVSARAGSDGVVYVFTLSTVWGDEVVFRMRHPPEWLFVGTPVTGYAVKVDDLYQMMDFAEAKELAASRAVEVESCQVSYTASGAQKQAIITGRAENSLLSVPAISPSVARKAEKIGSQKCVLHVAGLPTGNRVVAVQSMREYRRDKMMKKFMTLVGADERQ